MKVRYYLFKGVTPTQQELLKIAVSESRQTIWLASKKTNNEFLVVTDKFYDNDTEMQKCLAMTDDEFKATVIRTFSDQGYKLVNITEG